MSTSTTTLINTFVQRRLFGDGEIMYPNQDVTIQFEGPVTGLAFYGGFQRVALMEAANRLLDADNARILRSAIHKGLRIKLVETHKTTTQLCEAMEFELTGVTDLNGKELHRTDRFLSKLKDHLISTSQTIFKECLDIRSSGLDDVDYSDNNEQFLSKDTAKENPQMKKLYAQHDYFSKNILKKGDLFRFPSTTSFKEVDKKAKSLGGSVEYVSSTDKDYKITSGMGARVINPLEK